MIVSPVPALPIVAGAPALVANAYAAQHFGEGSRHSIQSVNGHVMVLHGIYQAGVSLSHAAWVRTRALRHAAAYP